MKLLRILAVALCLGALMPVETVYAGDAKTGSVFPRNLSVEELAKMVYEAAKNDPANAAIIFMDAVASRDSWTAAELRLVVDSLLIAVPDLPPSEVTSLMTNVPEEVVQQVTGSINNVTSLPQSPSVPMPPETPVYPVVPSPDEVSGVR